MKIGNKKQKEAFDIASKEALKTMQYVLTDYNKYSKKNYLNVIKNIAGDAPEALMVMQQSDEPSLNRHLGSTPGWGGSPALILNREVLQK